MRVAFVTNNASRRPSKVAERLAAVDIPATADEIVTSAQAAVRTVVARVPPGSVVLVLGTSALSEEVAEAGLRPVRTMDEAGSEPVAAVVQGLSPETCLADLAEATVALRAGALWVAGNADATLPSSRGPVPGNGAFVAALRLVTGLEPLVAGKPDPTLHLQSVQRVGAQRPLVIGDRLDTDVLGAVRGGADSLLVLTGVVDLPELLRAPAGSRPTFVSSDLRGLLQTHPAVVVQGDTARCGTVTASYADGVVRVAPPADGEREHTDDAIRVQAALAWACADAGRPLSD
jgi:HAD superfamily hydrolase (TIGR01450 family)